MNEPPRARPSVPHAPVLAAALALVLAASGARAQPVATTPVTVTDGAVQGTPIRRAQVETVFHAPFDEVAQRVLDFNRYPEFMNRVRSARVVRRRRNVTAVYFQLEMPRSLGVLWFLQEFTVQRRTPGRLELSGVAVDGNLGRVETAALVERLPGSSAGVRFVFSLLGVSQTALPPHFVNEQLRRAVRGVADGLRARLEASSTSATASR